MQAMKTFKTVLTTALTLKSIEYEEERDKIIYAMNTSEEKWEEVLMQKKKMKSIIILFIMKADFDQKSRKNTMSESMNVMMFWKCLRNVENIYMKFNLFWRLTWIFWLFSWIEQQATYLKF